MFELSSILYSDLFNNNKLKKKRKKDIQKTATTITINRIISVCIEQSSLAWLRVVSAFELFYIHEAQL